MQIFLKMLPNPTSQIQTLATSVTKRHYIDGYEEKNRNFGRNLIFIRPYPLIYFNSLHGLLGLVHEAVTEI